MKQLAIACAVLTLLTGCARTGADVSSTSTMNQGNQGAKVGGTAGAAVAFAVDSSNPMLTAALLVPSGATLGYYVGSMKPKATVLVQRGGAVFEAGDFITMVIPSDELFEPGTANLTDTSSVLIDAAAAIMVAHPNDNALITGHTDGVGTPLWQAKLSRKQALTLAQSLWHRGAFANSQYHGYQFAGLSDAKPIAADSTTNRGMQLNRRLQITLYPNDEAPVVEQKVDKSLMGSIGTTQTPGDQAAPAPSTSEGKKSFFDSFTSDIGVS